MYKLNTLLTFKRSNVTEIKQLSLHKLPQFSLLFVVLIVALTINLKLRVFKSD